MDTVSELNVDMTEIRTVERRGNAVLLMEMHAGVPDGRYILLVESRQNGMRTSGATGGRSALLARQALNRLTELVRDTTAVLIYGV